MKRFLEAWKVRPENFVQIGVGRNRSVDHLHEFTESAHAALRSNDAVTKVRWLLDAVGVHRAKQRQPIARMLKHLARRKLKLRLIKDRDAIHQSLLPRVRRELIPHPAPLRLMLPFHRRVQESLR